MHSTCRFSSFKRATVQLISTKGKKRGYLMTVGTLDKSYRKIKSKNFFPPEIVNLDQKNSKGFYFFIFSCNDPNSQKNKFKEAFPVILQKVKL